MKFFVALLIHIALTILLASLITSDSDTSVIPRLVVVGWFLVGFGILTYKFKAGAKK